MGVLAVCKQTLTLLNKNYKLKRRSMFGTLGECFAPILVVGMLVGFFWMLVGITGSVQDSNAAKYEVLDLKSIRKATDDFGGSKFLYSPNGSHPVIDDILKELKRQDKGLEIIGFENEHDLDLFSSEQKMGSVFAGIVFSELELEGSEVAVNYSIKMDLSLMGLPDTDKFFTYPKKDVIAEEMEYRDSGFLTIQNIIDSTLGKHILKNSDFTINQQIQRFPVNGRTSQEPAKRNIRAGFIKYVAGVWLLAAMLYSIYRLLSDLVNEKETRILEGMRMMGLNSTAYYVTWFVTPVIITTGSIALNSALLGWTQIYPDSDFAYVFLLYFLMSCSLVSMAFFMAVFISRSKLAGPIGCMIMIGISVAGIFVANRDIGTAGKYVLCLFFSPIAFSVGNTAIVEAENDGDGIHSGNLYDDGLLSVGSMLWVELFDVILYAFLAWYADNVFPSEYGTTQPFYFPFLPSYWFGSRHGKNKEVDGLLNPGDSNYKVDVEAHPKGIDGESPLVQIQGLRKVYGNGTVAVDHLNLDMYQGEILAFLGHNGAGKSTTIHMLTGLLPVSGGDAVIDGHSIRSNMQNVRESLGVCPQHDVIWKNLTVREHLTIFAGLKGVPWMQTKSVVNAMIEETGLSEKADDKAGILSGGQKRKLCVGIALIGGSKVVFLDEPTSGMDPLARRAVWTLLERNKKGRVIVLTTHFMDEADVLGDRIAIISRGRLRCVGSSLFLKSRFGIGYILSIVKDEQGCKVQKVLQTIKRFVPGVEVLSDVGKELTCRLSRLRIEYFSAMFAKLEQKRVDLGISSYGISITSLEEVFLRLAQEGDEPLEPEELLGASDVERRDKRLSVELNPAMKKLQKTYGIAVREEASETEESDQDLLMRESAVIYRDDNEDNDSDETDEEDDMIESIQDKKKHTLTASHLLVSGQISFVKQLYALLVKRGLISLRDWITSLVQILLPMCFVIGFIVILVELENSPPDELPSLLMSFTSVFVNHTSGFNLPYGLMSGDGTAGASIYVQSNEFMSTYISPQLGAHVDPTFAGNSTKSLHSFVLHNTEVAPSAIGFSGINSNYTLLNSTALFNASLVHSLPTTIATINRGFLNASLLASGSSTTLIKYVMYNSPFPPLKNNIFLNLNPQLWGAFLLIIGFSILPAMIATFNVKERVINAKHLQLANGVSRLMYWLSTFLYDMGFYGFFFCIGSLIVCAAGKWDYYGGGGGAGDGAGSFLEIFSAPLALYILFISYGLATFPISYLMGFMFKSPAMAQGIVAAVFGAPAFMFLISIISVGATNGADGIATEIVNYSFIGLSPTYAVTMGMLKMVDFLGFRSDITSSGELASVWDFYVLGVIIIALLGYFVIFTALLLIIDTRHEISGLLCRPFRSRKQFVDQLDDEDDDVTNERMRMGINGNTGDSIEIVGLRKVFGKNAAVKSLSLGIRAGECFGLLGHNGAGKTTTLRILSGDARPTAGFAAIAGHDILDDPRNAQRSIGFCPQFDAQFDQLTAREHLRLYARLKGLPNDRREQTIQSFIDMMDLGRYADKRVGGYSGGNKRKLSLALALIGNPKIVFLDEPSTGMDPFARRHMWSVIQMVRQDRAIILTTHSMEECDALCTRIGVMNHGQLICLGSNQHLKSKFGTGYRLDVKLSRPKGDSTEIAAVSARFEAWMGKTFDGAVLVEGHGLSYHYQVPQQGLSLSQVFGEIQGNKKDLGIQDYSVSQPTLEQIFLSQTKIHDQKLRIDEEARKAKVGCCVRFWCCCCRGNDQYAAIDDQYTEADNADDSGDSDHVGDDIV